MLIYSMVPSRCRRQVKVFSRFQLFYFDCIYFFLLAYDSRKRERNERNQKKCFYFQQHGCGKIPIWIYSYAHVSGLKNLHRTNKKICTKLGQLISSRILSRRPQPHPRALISFRRATQTSLSSRLELSSLCVTQACRSFTHMHATHNSMIHAPCIRNWNLDRNHSLLVKLTRHWWTSTIAYAEMQRRPNNLDTFASIPKKEQKENSQTISGNRAQNWGTCVNSNFVVLLLLFCVHFNGFFSLSFGSPCVYPE